MAFLPAGFRIAVAIFAGALAGVANLSAAIWRVNWDGNIPADFRSPQEANDSPLVHDGDTIILAVRNTFAELNLTKKLTVIGTGYYLAENFKSPYHGAMVTTIRLKAGSTGSTIQSLEIGDLSAEASVDSVTVSRCKVTNIVNDRITPRPPVFLWSIVNCVVANLNLMGPADATSTWPHYIITGNIIGPITLVKCSADLDHNVLNITAYTRFYRCKITNNIFGGYNGGEQQPQISEGCVVNNNILPNAPGWIPFWDFDGTNSVAATYYKGTSSSGGVMVEDVSRYSGATIPIDTNLTSVNQSSFGPFAGSRPYVYSGLPSVPLILNLDAPTVVTKESGLPVNVTIKSEP